jgi:hypothetical protein
LTMSTMITTFNTNTWTTGKSLLMA